MMGKNNGRRIRQALFSIRRFFTFFLLMSCVITCCMLLFLSQMSAAMGMDGAFPRDAIEQAARYTFLNVMLLSFLCTAVDEVWRKFTVERPVKRIVRAANALMKGDFSVRIQAIHSGESMDGFDTIIDCFNRMAQELSGMETLRDDFIVNVSHELKTPLAVIQNDGIMLQQPDLSQEKRLEYAGSVTEASRRLANLVANILKLNKLENQQIFRTNQRVNLGEQLCACLLTFENVWEEKGLGIETDIEEDVYVETDAELLTLVWNNLFSNAMKFTETNGSVSLSLKTKGNRAVVEISDTGCGISPEVGRHIFEKFYQGDASRATQGNGLGLALVKRVMEIVGGDIFVESEVSKGTTFRVELERCEKGETRFP